GPVVAAFVDWLAEQRSRVLPKSAIGEAITYAMNQLPALGVYLTEGWLTIDNAPAEQAIRPLAVGRRNWLHLGGDGGSAKPRGPPLAWWAGVPQGQLPDPAGPGPDRQVLVVRGEGDRPYHPGRPPDGEQFRAGGDVPELDRPVPAGRRHRLAIRGEHRLVQVRGVPPEPGQDAAGRHVP